MLKISGRLKRFFKFDKIKQMTTFAEKYIQNTEILTIRPNDGGWCPTGLISD